ncbi:HEAT repeat domain-containing protein [Kibdelosporangium aridum]|uniref:HEAT repeat domain-containing protein n=1 Tax=Kibdelosporangium aridum TaxID=2030 RepID=A0A1W2FMT9_KIBAR|nr:hypothetical protein [Kibdelosporangium aridum]SMD23307.1 hypothetical protein SAMN05661093_07881 [Kibdelosporangium aridum]
MTRVKPDQLLEEPDWDSLQHAYGPAGDTPGLLAQLLDDDPEKQAYALSQIEMSVLHQGSIYSSTAPAARYIAAILPAKATLAASESAYPWDDRERPLRAALLEWLANFAESATYQDADDPDVQACRAVLPEIYTAALPYVDDPDLTVREAALSVVTALPDLADARLFERILASSTDRRERAAAVFGLGAIGADTSALLEDADPAVAVCAALTCTDNKEATRLILDALQDPATADGWFPEPLPQFDGWFRFTLISAAIDRTETFEELLPAALAVVPLGSGYTVDSDWGPLLAKAFPAPFDGKLTPVQRQFVSAIAEHDRNWGQIANPLIWLRKAGLPETREELRAVARS